MGEHNIGGGQAACLNWLPACRDSRAGCLRNKPLDGLEKMVGTPGGLRNRLRTTQSSKRAAASQRAGSLSSPRPSSPPASPRLSLRFGRKRRRSHCGNGLMRALKSGPSYKENIETDRRIVVVESFPNWRLSRFLTGCRNDPFAE
jgi:hypothetical protein